ncbi:hypothetical protein CPB86DRAFT_819822 [Serendipita vermifera]|nr:hypothetical protein CPB86DRAFT_819822 [Serendipita vermifera]
MSSKAKFVFCRPTHSNTVIPDTPSTMFGGHHSPAPATPLTIPADKSVKQGGKGSKQAMTPSYAAVLAAPPPSVMPLIAPSNVALQPVKGRKGNNKPVMHTETTPSPVVALAAPPPASTSTESSTPAGPKKKNTKGKVKLKTHPKTALDPPITKTNDSAESNKGKSKATLPQATPATNEKHILYNLIGSGRPIHPAPAVQTDDEGEEYDGHLSPPGSPSEFDPGHWWPSFQEAQGSSYSLPSDDDSNNTSNTAVVDEVPKPLVPAKKRGRSPTGQMMRKRHHGLPTVDEPSTTTTESSSIHEPSSTREPSPEPSSGPALKPAPSSSFPHNSIETANTVAVSASSASSATMSTGSSTAVTMTTTTTQVTSTTASNSQAEPPTSEPFLIAARDEYKFSLFQLGFFPNPEEKIQYAEESWLSTIDTWSRVHNVDKAPVDYTTSIQSMLWGVGSEIRGQIKSKASLLVSFIFELDLPDLDATKQQREAFRKARAEYLLRDRAFLFMKGWSDPVTKLPNDKVPFTHRGIAQVIQQSLFHKTLKPLERKALLPIPIPVITIACSAIECALDEYKETGAHSAKSFTEQEYADSYKAYVDGLEGLSRKRSTRFEKIANDIQHICIPSESDDRGTPHLANLAALYAFALVWS